MSITLLCNADFEARLCAVPLGGQRARRHAAAVAQGFALCGPPGSRVFFALADTFFEVDAEAIRRAAEREGVYHAATAEQAPWNAAQSVVAYAHDDRETALAARLGVALSAPNLAMVRRVNGKDWSVELSQRHGWDVGAFAFARVVRSAAALEEHLLAVPQEVARQWTVKPVWGFAGGGRLHGTGRIPTAQTMERVARLIRRDGVALFEPWVHRETDFSTLIHVGDRKTCVLGHTGLFNTKEGRYRGNRLFQAPESVKEALHAAAVWVAHALAEEGYRGAAGIDAFLFRDPLDDTLRLRPVVEVNARFTLGLVAWHLAQMASETGRLGCNTTWELHYAPDVEPWRWLQPPL
jgi:hypothetical protein